MIILSFSRFVNHPPKKRNERNRIRGYGMLLIDESLNDLVIETISSIHIRGKIKCLDRIREHYQL